MNKKIAIWGTGTLAKKFYCLYKDKSNITCFFDNDEKKHNKLLFGIPIKKWISSDKHKIIIASIYWREISNQLMASGLCIEKDFEIYSKYLEIGGQNYSQLYYLTDKNLKNLAKEILLPQKKIAVVYGNCQTTLIENAMRQHSVFSKEFTVIQIPKVCEYVNNREMLEYFIRDEIFWKQVDLFIYQTVSVDNKFSEILIQMKFYKNYVRIAKLSIL